MIAWLFKSGVLLAGISTLAVTSGDAQDQLGWGRATQVLTGTTATNSALAASIAEWKSLQQSSSYGFDSYARFLLAHPGWPGETAMRRMAEKALDSGGWSPSTVVAFFRRFPALTGAGKTRFAEALAATGQQGEAASAARAAWVSGTLSSTDESKILATFPGALSPADHDARMDMLLWQGATAAAQRQLMLTSPARQSVFAARLAFRTSAPDAGDRLIATQAYGATDPGWIADRAIWYRNTGASASARNSLAQRPALAVVPGSAEQWFEVLLTNARAAANDGQNSLAYDIARKLGDAYPIGTDVSTRPYGERDDYTSLAWLAGRTALKQLARPADAVPLFVSYAAASKTPTTQSKGLYWAGRAAEAAGRRDEANGYYARAAAFRDLFYGQLAAERIGQPLVAPGDPVLRPVDPSTRGAFYARETVRAAQYLGTVGNWEDQTAFVRQIALDAKTDSDHVLATELSRTLGRPDLGVMVGRSALQNGLSEYSTVGFPNVRVPVASQDDWTMIHAIARQESQFDRAAISHAGARGLMQLMPGTARDQAGKLGLAYNAAALTTDTDYNIMVGSTYFRHIYDIYGSYPLAVAAYNAGPGNVNKWLRANGDPRSGGVDMLDWIEAIPIYETRNYVQRVLENAVVYDLMNPTRSRSSGSNRISWYLGKRIPG
ncbi:lytic transglycosylase domain-containing protein [Sphingomonas sp. 10B4]|uniref:lytic transglycosylase domain-containing protein n=1 Tax=Sphingomonas sp. 10B4 TaxID=3048575 RepID=UPI002AB38553|nr:lytic transglycosylase domain-containing protein [Sphingomonas sp. 10B4]MDY7525668.1 lytic transglycosylase domain-containing protein [Sphingomonas sp. 10B4]MEB0282477.1 lytic transglycosylase domain-containing protein [Sphingomonas sp. 10B4]